MDRQTDAVTDIIMMPIADHTMYYITLGLYITLHESRLVYANYKIKYSIPVQ